MQLFFAEVFIDGTALNQQLRNRVSRLSAVFFRDEIYCGGPSLSNESDQPFLIEYIAAAKKLVYSLKQRILASNNTDATKNGMVLLYVSNAFIPSYKFKLKKLKVLFHITYSRWL